MENTNTNSGIPEFHMGLTMAGAASAGCYTGGAMDYLFEILDLWENAKKGILPPDWDKKILSLIPQHKVIIDVMGGTSAGGMTTVMSAIYALTGKVNPVRDPKEIKTRERDNIFYDSWVIMGDKDNGKPLMEKTLETTDLDGGKIQSLLNSDFIDAICDNVYKGAKGAELPPYISPDLKVILSHTMLSSIPLNIDFTTPIGKERNKKNPVHCFFEHFTVSRFKLSPLEKDDENKYLPLDPFGPGGATMKLATKATGAFPIGLRFREFFHDELSSAYLKKMAEIIAFNRFSDTPEQEVPAMNWPDAFGEKHPFISIDGGAINNEPFGEVLAILKEAHGKKGPKDDYKYAMVMIDPFPDFPPPVSDQQPDDLFSVVPAIIGTLWDQAKVKRSEMLDAYSSDYYRGEIFPVRAVKKDGDEPYAIACGSAMAFGGFLDINFRHHDFFLGRDNARNFYRTFFTLRYNPKDGIIHPIHASWTPEMVALFRMPGKVEGESYLPIIPDLYFLKAKMEGTYKGPWQERTVTDWPKYDPQQLFKLRSVMEARVTKMLELAYDRTKKNVPEEEKNPLTKKWIESEYRTGWFKKLTGGALSWTLGASFGIAKGAIAKKTTKAAMEWILKDLEKMGLLIQK